MVPLTEKRRTGRAVLSHKHLRRSRALRRVVFNLQIDLTGGRETGRRWTVKFIRPRQVVDMIGVSRTTLWRMVQAGTFPRPVRITERNWGFLLETVESWMKARVLLLLAVPIAAAIRWRESPRPRACGRARHDVLLRSRLDAFDHDLNARHNHEVTGSHPVSSTKSNDDAGPRRS